MNIIYKLTFRQLMKNKQRTLITIIGVMISVAMLTAVATLITSFLSVAQKEHIANEGKWHILYKDVNEKQLEKIASDKYTDQIILSRDLGYSHLEESSNPAKPYLFFKQYNQDGFEQFPIELSAGRLPKKEDELLIPEHIMTNGQVDFAIGDQITAHIGERFAKDEDIQNPLGQTFELQMTDEKIAEVIQHPEKKQYTIVGVMKRPTWEPYTAPGFTVLSYLPEKNFTDEDPVNVSVVWNQVNQRTLQHAKELGESLQVGEVSTNDSLLRYYGLIQDDFLKKSLYSVAAIVMLVIMIGSVSLIYNAFIISVAERSRHLGMLSSVGATKIQKRNSVFFEGLIIGAVGIPFGIISGIGGISITFYLINPIFQRVSNFSEKLTVVVTPMSILVTVVLATITIFISTYIPARRASRISVIDAIRQAEDIKLSRKNVRTSKLTRKIFGIEADLALKNLKRNKGKYYATVFSLVISIVLFLTVSFFGDQLRISSNLSTSGLNYDIKMSPVMSGGEFNKSLIDSVASMEEVTDISELSYAHVEAELKEEEIHESLQDLVVNGKYQASVSVYMLDEPSLRTYAEELGVSYERLTDKEQLTGIVINKAYLENQKGEITSFYLKPGDQLPLQISDYDWDEKGARDIGNLEVAAVTGKRPIGVSRTISGGHMNIILSQEVFAEMIQDHDIEQFAELVLISSDPMSTHEKIEPLVDAQINIENPHKTRQEEEGIIFLISVFTYGFITLITLISIANIFNTISTSISLRMREFGVLKSVGMTPKGFNRMIRYESLFYGIQSLFFGLPISGGIMYLIYREMSKGFEYTLTFPWKSILSVVIAVFIIVGLTMMYASQKVRRGNIVDALKRENI